MPQVYFLDNYCYEISNLSIAIYKYDIIDQQYIKIDHFSTKQKLPPKYENALRDIEDSVKHTRLTSLEQNFADIKIAS